ncbi:MAG: hypothetical protein V4507_11565 [Verrucomicrobiota bacterium]
MKRVRTKTYSVTLYLVLFAVAIQFGVIIWNFSIRSQVKIDIQAPELPLANEPTQQTLPVSTESKSNKLEPLGTPSSKPASETISSHDHVQNLLSEAHKFLEQGDTSLARNTLLEAEKIQPNNIEVLTQIADLAEKIQNNELAADYRARIQKLLANQAESTTASTSTTEASSPKSTEASEPTKTNSTASTSPEESSNHLLPVLPPNAAQLATVTETSSKRVMIGTSEKRMLQSATSKTEFLLKIPIIATPAATPIEPGKVSIKLYFYEQQSDGKIIPSTARLDVSFENRRPTWSHSSETLNALYSLPATQVGRSYFGYRMRIYYKGQFQDEVSEPENLNEKYPMNY